MTEQQPPAGGPIPAEGTAPPAPPPQPPPPGLAATAPLPEIGPRPGRHGLGVLLYLGVTYLITGIEGLIVTHDQGVAGAIAVAVGVLLIAVALGVRVLRQPPELRSAVALGGVALCGLGAGLAASSDVQLRPRILLATLVAGALAAVVARVAVSAVASGVAAGAAVVATGVLASTAGANPLQAAAVAGALALVVVAVAPLTTGWIGHPSTERWVAGTGAVLAGPSFYIAGLLGPGVSAAAAGVGAAALAIRAQRLGHLGLALAAAAGLSIAVTRMASQSGRSTTAVGVFLIVAGTLTLLGVLAGSALARQARAQGRPMLVPPAVDAVGLGLAAVLLLIAASSSETSLGSPFTPFTVGSSTTTIQSDPTPFPASTPYPLPPPG